ncbi:MAG: hypothetical protein U9R74_06000 [Pseudomonadota bacterium]|nr:hypothetical protein [Pseudomonadota bacterium]
MKILFLTMMLFMQGASAALPPQHQNMKDLDVMVNFVRARPEVSSTLHSIDLSGYTIHYGNGCKAVFVRKSLDRPQGLVGPAGPLEFSHAGCESD